MQVSFIGSGNVATVLGREFLKRGWTVREIYSRNTQHAASLARELKADIVSDVSKTDPCSDVYFLCVTDDAIPSVASQLHLHDRLLIHTSGSVGKHILKNASSRYGVLWPMKMIRKSMPSLGDVSIVIDGDSDATKSTIHQIASMLSGKVIVADDALRGRMHMLASVVSNFPNHLYRLAADYCEREGVDFSAFYPIIEETARALRSAHPSELQAGPAFRGDIQTMESHRRLLAGYPELKLLYNVFSDGIAQVRDEIT